MIALDTNVLVRFLVEDDAVQSAKATALIELIREHGLAAGCTAVATFDQALLKETGYQSP